MATRKARTDTQKELDKDKRLREKFGITLADRHDRERQQNFRCKICGGPLDPPCVDHFHFKISVARTTVGDVQAYPILKWKGQGFDERGNIIYSTYASTQEKARAAVKDRLMPWSIRALLCRYCNRKLGVLERWFDAARTPDAVLPFLEYLRARL